MGYKFTEEHKRNLSKSRMGHRVSLATRKKMSNTRKGMKLTKQHKRNIGKAHIGKKSTKETKEKMSKAALQREKRKRWQKRWAGLNFLRRL